MPKLDDHAGLGRDLLQMRLCLREMAAPNLRMVPAHGPPEYRLERMGCWLGELNGVYPRRASGIGHALSKFTTRFGGPVPANHTARLMRGPRGGLRHKNKKIKSHMPKGAACPKG
jgi:hypothetical protein